MRYSITQTGAKISPNVVNLVVDTDADIGSLPTHFSPGSSCIVTGSSNVYMLNNAKTWVIL